MWKIVDVFGIEELVESGVDCIFDFNVVENLEVNGEKFLVIDSDGFFMFFRVVFVEVVEVNIWDVVRGVWLILEGDVF